MLHGQSANFVEEYVTIGHPDKIADQISDAILDACLQQDPNARVACETLVTRGLVVLAGEISLSSPIDYQDVVRQTIKDIGYIDPEVGFDYRSCGVIVTINKQSPDIAQGVEEKKSQYKEQGAGDQGLMFGFACNETPQLMPMPIMLAHAIVRELRIQRQDRVVILLENCPEAVICLYGVLKAGGVFVVLDRGTSAGRLKYVLENSGASVLVSTTSQSKKIQEAFN